MDVFSLHVVANCDRFHPAPGCGNFCIFSIRPPSAVDFNEKLPFKASIASALQAQ
ncbi:hypothetical protein [uncultured Fibrobacter sp.]|uniref:hypothetical protein n=1 Tax=uncultured Fibrobacter sp. TaxID=261512 RepID=UPI0025CC7F7A|nr:hypothetical protein [uncultured Fibrobacter sp.]